jgi:predicted phosphodiesterase
MPVARPALQHLRADAAWILKPLVIGIVGAWFAVGAFGHQTVEMGPFHVRFDATFGRGLTDIALPPLGTLRANTHLAPLHLRATLQDVDVDALQPYVTSPDGPARLAASLEQQTTDRMLPFGLWLLEIGCLGALTLGALVFREPRRAVAALLVGLITVAGAEGLTLETYDAKAFLTPSYSGTLALAPQLFGPVEGTIKRVGYFRDELERIVASAGQAYAAIEANPLGRGDEITVLHISDIHLSTLGYGFALRLAQGFNVDMVLDTGDTGSFGTEAEQAILSWVPRFERPYVFVRGSHDSFAFQQAVARYQNATVLDGNAATVAGLTIYGLGDPYFVSARGAPKADAQITRLVESVAPGLRDDVRTLPEPPDIIAVHDERMAELAAGYAPLVASGHFHTNVSRVQDGTLFLQVGTTGGAGPTGFTPEGDVPFSAEILYFRASADGTNRLIAWDVIQELPATGSFSVKRHVVVTDYGEISPSPSPEETPTPTGPSGASGASGASG